MQTVEQTSEPMSMRWVFLSLLLLAAVVVLTLFEGLATTA